MPSRRQYLAALGLSALAGCLGGDPTETATDRTASPTGAEYPSPTAPQTGTPPDSAPMPTGGPDWSTVGGDAGRTASLDGTAVPEEHEVRWAFLVYGSRPVVSGSGLFTGEGRNGITRRDARTGRVDWNLDQSYDGPAGGGSGPPLVADGTLYLQRFTGLEAYDAETGDGLWETELGSGPPAAPVTDGDAVFLAQGSFDTSATLASVGVDGEERWRLTVGDVAFGAPALGDGAVFAVTDAGLLLAVDTDGEERWRETVGEGAAVTPSVRDGTVYLHDGEGTVHARRTSDGSDHWTVSVGGAGSLAVGESVVIAGTESGVVALDRATGEERWHAPVGSAGSPAVDDEAVYVGVNENIYALSLADGSERWSVPTEEQAVQDVIHRGVYGPPTLVEGGLYVLAADGLRAIARPDA